MLVSTLLIVGFAFNPAQASCAQWDLTGDGTANVVDVQCHIDLTLAELVGTRPPACVGPAQSGDYNQNGSVNVVDTQLLISGVLSCVDGPAPSEDWTRDILHTDLVADIQAMEATATITVAAANTTGASFEVGSLNIDAVWGPDGDLEWQVVGDRLDVGVTAGEENIIVIDYAFDVADPLEGGLLSTGATRTWPTYCGNLFPCHSDPADGMTWTLDVLGTPRGEKTIYASEVETDAPSYMLAWATADFDSYTFATTDAGTTVEAHLLDAVTPAQQANLEVAANAFGFYEAVLGDYAFGEIVGVVEVEYPEPAWLMGMEHHPWWHLAPDLIDDIVTMVHEPAHGWYGNGVRIACWEDFVLSEGATTYLSAVALGDMGGANLEADVWSYYQQALYFTAEKNTVVAWPDGCGAIGSVEAELYNGVPYYKGAFFLKAVENEIGRPQLLSALSGFYQARVGTAATTQEFIDYLEADTGFDTSALVDTWLKSTGMPAVFP